MKYRADVDGLRALAVLPVILYHAGFEWFRGGYVGVDVFFVISGYLITTLIVRELLADGFSLLNFYERRARRILPALFFVMLVCIVFAMAWMTPDHLQKFGQSLMGVSTFSSNVLFWLESGYFDAAVELKPLLHTWSLAVEEQYYIAFPLFLLVTWRFGLMWVLSILLMAFFISLTASHWGALNKPSATFYLLPTRIWELLIGVFIAFYLHFRGDAFSLFSDQLLSLVGLALIVFAVFVFDASTPFPSAYTLLPTLGAGMIIVGGVSRTWVNRFLSTSPMVLIGLVSYSAYLWHQPILVFARHRWGMDRSGIDIFALCLLSFALAYVSWRWVERPFRDTTKVTPKVVGLMSVFGLLFFFFIGVGLHIKQGFFGALHHVNIDVKRGDIGHQSFHSYVSRNFQHCQDAELMVKAERFNGVIRCQKTTSKKPSIALFGDSHAEHLFVGLAEKLDRNLVYLSKGGRAFVGEDSHAYLLQYIRRTDDIDTVVYSTYWWSNYRSLGQEGFRHAVRQTLMQLTEAGKHIVVVAGAPDFIVDASNCFFSTRFNPSHGHCSLTKKALVEQQKYLPILTHIVNELGLELIDLTPLFCDERRCSMVRDGAIMYRDNDHLSLLGSREVGAFLYEHSDILQPTN